MKYGDTCDSQLTGRRLVDEDAQSLLDEMNKLNDAGIIQFTDAKMEKFSRDEQVRSLPAGETVTDRLFSSVWQ